MNTFWPLRLWKVINTVKLWFNDWFCLVTVSLSEYAVSIFAAAAHHPFLSCFLSFLFFFYCFNVMIYQTFIINKKKKKSNSSKLDSSWIVSKLFSQMFVFFPVILCFFCVRCSSNTLRLAPSFSQMCLNDWVKKLVVLGAMVLSVSVEPQWIIDRTTASH